MKYLLPLFALLFLPGIMNASDYYVVDVTIGQVEIYQSASDSWTRAKVGDLLVEEDGIRTGSGAYCDVVMPDRGIFRVSADSELYMSEMNGEEETVEVKKGGFFANIINAFSGDNGEETFEVETTAAVVAIRGTRFAVKVNQDTEDMDIEVQNGTVNARPNVDLSMLEDEEVIGSFEDELEMEVSSEEYATFEVETTQELEEDILSGIDGFLSDIDEGIDSFINDMNSQFDQFIEDAEQSIDDMLAEADKRFENILNASDDMIDRLMDNEVVGEIVGDALEENPISVARMDRQQQQDLDDTFEELSDEQVAARMEARMSASRGGR